MLLVFKYNLRFRKEPFSLGSYVITQHDDVIYEVVARYCNGNRVNFDVKVVYSDYGRGGKIYTEEPKDLFKPYNGPIPPIW